MLQSKQAGSKRLLGYAVAAGLVGLGANAGTQLYRHWPQVVAEINPEESTSCPVAPNLKVGAYYYSWYTAEKWREPITHTPSAPGYVSSDPAVIARHVQEARRAGIDYFIISWTPQKQHEVTASLDELDKLGFPYMVLYESHMALERGVIGQMVFGKASPTGETLGERFAAHMEQFQRDLASRRGYYKINGKPALIIYVARDLFEGARVFESAFAKLRSSPQGAYLIADAIYWDDAPGVIDERIHMDLFDAVTAYNLFADHHRDGMRDYLTNIDRIYGTFDTYLKKQGGTLIPNTQPGYNDRALRGMDRPVVERDNGQFFAKSFELAHNYAVRNNNQIFLTSFNEWFEGTEIETSQQNGDAYLRQLCSLKTAASEKSLPLVVHAARLLASTMR